MNLCGYYVCEYIRIMVNERDNTRRSREVRKHHSQLYFATINCVSFLHIIDLISFFQIKMAKKRNQLLPENRVKAIAEELEGFLLAEVIPETGEYHYSEE